MTIFLLLLCLLSSISASTVVPIDSQHPKSSDFNVVSIDSQTFFADKHKPTIVHHPKSYVPTVIPVDSQTIFDSEAKSSHFDATTVIPIDSQTFFTGMTKPTRVKASDLTVLPVDSQTFFNSEAKPPHTKAFPVTVKHPKPSGLTAIHIDSQTFFNHKPKSSLIDSTVRHPKSSDINVFPIDSRTFFTSEPKPPRLDAIQHDSASYCSVYLKKENLKKGAIVCPLFAVPSPTQESSVRSICQHRSQENEFKFCSSSYKEISKKVMDKLGKNKLVSSVAPQMNISTITGIKRIAAYGQAVVCHKAQYVGFYCHQIGKSTVFALKLSDFNGDRRKYANMFAVCHDDTTSWDGNRLVFKILKCKPSDAICHLLPSYDLVWVALA